jgi:hypothetical protein
MQTTLPAYPSAPSITHHPSPITSPITHHPYRLPSLLTHHPSQLRCSFLHTALTPDAINLSFLSSFPFLGPGSGSGSGSGSWSGSVIDCLSFPSFPFLACWSNMHAHLTHTQGFKQDDTVYASLPKSARTYPSHTMIQARLCSLRLSSHFCKPRIAFTHTHTHTHTGIQAR